MGWQEQSLARRMDPFRKKGEGGCEREAEGEIQAVHLYCSHQAGVLVCRMTQPFCCWHQAGMLVCRMDCHPFPIALSRSHSSQPNVLWVEPSLHPLHPLQISHTGLQHSVCATVLCSPWIRHLWNKTCLLWLPISVAQCY